MKNRYFSVRLKHSKRLSILQKLLKRNGDTWIENRLQLSSDEANPGVFRIAFKMATGTGKTVVMAMLIAWQALNKIANPRDSRFTDFISTCHARNYDS